MRLDCLAAMTATISACYQPMLTTSVGAAMPLSSSVRSAVTENDRRAASRVARLTRISGSVRRGTDAGGEADTRPDVVGPGSAGLSGMDADPHRRREALPRAVSREATLERDHRLDRPRRIAEGEEEAVTGVLDHLTAVLGDDGSHRLVVPPQDGVPGRVAERLAHDGSSRRCR